jgi:hypothetical protein
MRLRQPPIFEFRILIMEGLGEELQAEVEAIQSFLIEGEGEEVKVSPSHAKMAVHTIGNLPTVEKHQCLDPSHWTGLFFTSFPCASLLPFDRSSSFRGQTLASRSL